MKKSLYITFMLCTIFGYSQNLNNYKYALLPSKFSFQKEKDQYNVNSIVRMILEKNQFETYRDDEKFSEDFANENCNKVYVDLDVVNTMFITKVKIILKDCKNTVLFTSLEGRSKSKENAVAYLEALREASRSLDVLNHKYEPAQQNLLSIGESKLVETKITQNKEFENSDILNKIIINEKQFIATSTSLGWNLINPDKKMEIIMFKTTLNDFYIAKKNDKQGIIYLKNSFWFFEYYDGDFLKREQLRIQF